MPVGGSHRCLPVQPHCPDISASFCTGGLGLQQFTALPAYLGGKNTALLVRPVAKARLLGDESLLFRALLGRNGLPDPTFFLV